MLCEKLKKGLIQMESKSGLMDSEGSLGHEGFMFPNAAGDSAQDNGTARASDS